MSVIDSAVLEKWKPIKDFPGYYISNCGRVLGISGKILKPTEPCKNWHYYSVCLKKNGKDYRRTIHRLVADAFIPNPESLPVVNHKDEDKLNNHVENLEWCSIQYNCTYGKNIWAGRNKIAEERAKPVEMIDGEKITVFKSIRDASRITGINRHCISRACSGELLTAGKMKWRFAV